MAGMNAAATPGDSGRVLIIGLDGATWTNLLPRAQRGEMPWLQRMLREGARGVLNSTIPALTPPAWTSLVTGTNPGKHGIYHFRHTPAGNYYQQRLNISRDIHAPTIWQRVGEAGKKVGVINVPLSFPVYPVNGFITSDAFAPDAGGMTVYPPELTDDFKDVPADIERYPKGEYGTEHFREEMFKFIEANEKVMVRHTDAALRQMSRQPWQFFMVVWLILDRVQHYAWKFCEPDAETKLTGIEKQLAVRCAETFKRIDTELGRLMEAAGKGCTVMLVSDHGFGAVPRTFFHTNRWLVQQGHLNLLPAWSPSRIFLGNFPRAWRPRWKLPLDSKFGVVDWRRTRVWADCLEARAVGLRINRVGKYPGGIVTEAEYEPLCRQLVEELGQVKADSGEKVFAKFYRGKELYHGAQADMAPDLVAIMSKPFDGPPSFRRDLRSKKLTSQNRHMIRDGGHEPDGVVALWGRAIRTGVELSPQEIVSVAPTAMRLMGLPAGEDMDGQVIRAALKEEELGAAGKSVAAAAAASAAPAPEYSDADSNVVEERLRNLGYLD